jgi:hypothetical protein
MGPRDPASRDPAPRDTASPADSPIELYLDQLLVACRTGRPRETRHLLAETEAHLRDAAAEARSQGQSGRDAEVQAVTRFGSVSVVADAELGVQTTPIKDLVRQAIASGLLVGGVGGVAVGVSGLIAAGLAVVAGQRFVVDAPSGAALSPAYCSRWLAGTHAMSCAQAGLADWMWDTVAFRLAAGVIGVLALLAVAGIGRAWSRQGRLVMLPATVRDTAAALSFGVAGVWLAGLGVDRLAVASGHGAGQWFSAAPVALAVAVFFGLRLVGDLRRPSYRPVD